MYGAIGIDERYEELGMVEDMVTCHIYEKTDSVIDEHDGEIDN